MKEIQGEWSLQEVVSGGKPFAEKRLKGMVLKVSGNSWKVWEGGKINTESTFVVDSTKRPIEIDMTTEGEGPDEKELGILLFEADMLKVILNGPKGARPSQFTVAPGDKKTFISLKRK